MYPYQNPALHVNDRIHDLLARMSVPEKIGQLVKLDGFRSYTRQGEDYVLSGEFLDKIKKYPIGSLYGLIRADWWTEKDWNNGVPAEQMAKVQSLFQSTVMESSRWGIPLYVAEEAPHGLMALGATVFPTGLGLGSTWDKDLLLRIGRVIGTEARAAGVQTVYGPILDLARDPRWSRVEENYSEDPYLTSVFGVQMVKGITSARTVSTLKHFLAHGSPEGGHNSYPAHLGPIELYNGHLRPFRDAIKAGAKSIMSAYSTVDQEPSSGSYHLLTKILRDELHFDGFVVSDRGAICLLESQRLASDNAEACALALKAGCDVDEGNFDYVTDGLEKALVRGLITIQDLDVAVGRMLKVKFDIGLFETPFPTRNPAEILGCPAHHVVAHEASRKSLVLLKNNGILPLTNLRSLAVIGPNADNMMNQLGDYTAPQKRHEVYTVLDGLRQLSGTRGISIHYAPGCKVRHLDQSGFAGALAGAEKADAVVLVLGGSSTKYGTTMRRTDTGAAEVPAILGANDWDKESGEGTDRATLTQSGVQLELFRELCKTGKPVIVVLIQGRPLEVNEYMDQAAAVLMAWYPGMFGGLAVAEALLGDYNPGGRLPVSVPRHPGQLPVFYNHTTWNCARADYVDMSGAPRLLFGYGLSYTTFAYSGLTIDGRTVSVTVHNTGARDGDEVVQCYLTDLKAMIVRPVIELAAFERIHLRAGETARVSLELGDEVLGYYDATLQFRVESGVFRIRVGGSLESALEAELVL